MNRLACTLTLLTTFAAAPALAQAPVCHDGDRFRVAALEYADNAGTRFAVTPVDSGEPCAFDESADFVIGSEGDPLWFGALRDPYLVLTRSTGPQGDVVVYDLAAKAKLLDVPADAFADDDAGVTFWERTEAGTERNCPRFAEYQANGLGAVIAVETRFDFASRQSTPTGNRRCDATQ